MPSPDRSRLPRKAQKARKQTSRDGNIVLRRTGASSKDDAAFVRSVAHKAFLAYGSYDNYLRDWFENDAVSSYVAELDGNRAGFFMLTTYRDSEGSGGLVADLVAIAVEPEYQSRGVGRNACSLTRSLSPQTRIRRRAKCGSWSPRGTRRRNGFFARHGFRLRDGVGVYPAGQRALRMVKSLEVKS